MHTEDRQGTEVGFEKMGKASGINNDKRQCKRSLFKRSFASIELTQSQPCIDSMNSFLESLLLLFVSL